jgi:hypothetical protein
VRDQEQAGHLGPAKAFGLSCGVMAKANGIGVDRNVENLWVWRCRSALLRSDGAGWGRRCAVLA